MTNIIYAQKSEPKEGRRFFSKYVLFIVIFLMSNVHYRAALQQNEWNKLKQINGTLPFWCQNEVIDPCFIHCRISAEKTHYILRVSWPEFLQIIDAFFFSVTLHWAFSYTKPTYCLADEIRIIYLENDFTLVEVSVAIRNYSKKSCFPFIFSSESTISEWWFAAWHGIVLLPLASSLVRECVAALKLGRPNQWR